MAVAFLFTCVQKLDVDDYKKLVKITQYLQRTKELTLTIQPSDHPSWWVDNSYAIHPETVGYL